MTQAQLNFNLKLAKEAGNDANGDSYEESYKYHLGMIDPPLPFNLWKIKFDLLTRIQAIPESDPRYFADSTMKKELQLCSELGY